MFAAEQFDELELGVVRVLVFVHQNVPVTILVLGSDLRVFGEKLDSQQQQIIEIHCVGVAKRRVVTANGVLDEFILNSAVVLGAADQ